MGGLVLDRKRLALTGAIAVFALLAAACDSGGTAGARGEAATEGAAAEEAATDAPATEASATEAAAHRVIYGHRGDYGRRGGVRHRGGGRSRSRTTMTSG